MKRYPENKRVILIFKNSVIIPRILSIFYKKIQDINLEFHLYLVEVNKYLSIITY
jgi:hypothetical protein